VVGGGGCKDKEADFRFVLEIASTRLANGLIRRRERKNQG
jgi:hypothetical protein